MNCYCIVIITLSQGHFEAFPFDTETVRLFREDHKITASTQQALFNKAEQHYSKYSPYQFIAYWFDLWQNYERKNGKLSPQWEVKDMMSCP